MIFIPSDLLISIEGILIPAPEPSSDIATYLMSSSDESITIPTAPPASSIFLTFVTKLHPPLSARTKGALANIFYDMILISKSLST
jgi:hypothetical protein